MKTATASAFGELRDWQLMLDRHAELFSEMLPGSSVGFVPRAGSGIQPGKHVAGLLGSSASRLQAFSPRRGFWPKPSGCAPPC